MKKKCRVCSKNIYGRYSFCDKCFKRIQNNKNVYNDIKKLWKLDAKLDDGKFFYLTEEVNEIIDGNKCMIIGNKGDGKTAIAQYIYNLNLDDSKIFTEKLSFKDFPFNTLYELSDESYPRPNQYISLWKEVIYIAICKLMITNNNIDVQVNEKLEKIFLPNDTNKKMSKLINSSYINKIGLKILQCGIDVGIGEKNSNISWYDTVGILENIIINSVDDSRYYIIFDELDEDYKSFDSREERQKYFDLITGLFKAIQDTKATFNDKNLSIFPIIFLRTDIYDQITYSDKNKWSDSLINIVWNKHKIKSFLKYRLEHTCSIKGLSFEEYWTMLFSNYKIRYGTRKEKNMTSFEFIMRSTRNRPRDYISFFKECAKKAIQENSLLINPNILKEADNDFSDYMKKEIIDEIYAKIPEYEHIFDIISLIRKQTFNPSEFVSRYDERKKKGVIQNDKNAEAILKILFEHSVIGNVPSINNQAIFKYEKNSAKFNFKENIIIHRGLYKALQIF